MLLADCIGQFQPDPSNQRMISRLFIVYCIIILILKAPALNAQVTNNADQVRFQHISQDEIYGMGKVWDVLEDHLGFMWFATEDGLLRYDGYNFESYKQGERPGSLSSNFTIDLHEDRNHNLWIATLGGGLNLYNRNENRFYSIVHDAKNPHSLPSNRISGIFEDHSGVLWIGTEGGGIASLNPAEVDFNTVNNSDYNFTDLKFISYQRKKNPDHNLSIAGNFVRSNITEDKYGNLYIGSYRNGITVINAARDSATFMRHDPANPNSLSSDDIYELMVDSKNRLWIGTENHGVDLYLIDKKTFLHYRADGNENSLSNNQIETLGEDASGNIWIGSDNGLSLLLTSHEPMPRNKFVTFKHQPFNESSLLSNSIKEIYTDKNNSLWVASYYGGINKYNPASFKFTPIRVIPWEKKSLTDNNITAIQEDKNGNLWIGTDGGGLNFLPGGVDNFYNNAYQYVELINPVTKKAERKIKCLLLTEDEELWIGTWAGGLLRYDLKTKKVTYFGMEDPRSGLNVHSVLDLGIDRNGDVWIATFNQGLARYDREKKTFTTYVPDVNKVNRLTADRLNIIMVDSKNNVWVGGEIGGLHFLDRDNNTFKPVRVDDLITDQISVNCLLESKDGNIWLGTLQGIIRYNPETKTAEKFSAADGLVGDGVQSILQDDTGVLWISTTNGLSRFDPAQNIFTSYTHFDGLQGNNFNRNSALKASNGLLLFGGANGWNGFDPATIKKQDKRSPLVFTRFFVNGVPVTYNTPGSPLEAEINSGKVIHLDHDKNNFGVMFALLEYNFASLANYSYKLEGLNESWIDIGKSRITAFTNLDPGSYTFRIKASNKDGYWHESDKTLSVVIHPAWWQTLWFKASIIFLLSGIVYGGFKLRLSQLTVQRNRLENLVEERTASLASVNAMLAEKNNEIQAQNEELFSQNEQIITQREELLLAKKKLEEINKDLEGLVIKRTAHLNEVISKLDHSVKTLDRFVYSASHDLSAPMKTIRGLLHVAAMEKDSSNTLEYFNLIKESIKRFEEVIISMSNFSRNSHHEVVIEPVNISNRVIQIFHDMKYWPEAERITFYNEIEPDTFIPADRYRLETILQNLIGNSIKYADPKKARPYIKVRCFSQPDRWLLEVEDNGIGIKKGYEGKIFDMFFKASEASKGSGLGLFIVSEAVSKLKGTIEVESVYEEGTTFKIAIPLHRHPA